MQLPIVMKGVTFVLLLDFLLHASHYDCKRHQASFGSDPFSSHYLKRLFEYAMREFYFRLVSEAPGE
jgi:hypothetical protein